MSQQSSNLWALILIPALTLLKVNIGGELYASEILLFAMAVIAAIQGYRPRKVTGGVMMFALFWLLAQNISDINNGSLAIDRIRGSSRIIFFAVDIYALDRLVRSYVDVLALLLGTAIYYLINPIIDPIVAKELPDLWKFGLGGGLYRITIVALAYFSAVEIYNLNQQQNHAARNKKANPLVRPAQALVLLAAISFLLNSRSFAATLIATAAIWIWLSTRRAGAIKETEYFAIFVMAPLLAWGIFSFYSSAAEAGILGESAHDKFIAQMSNSRTLLEVIASGRNELYSSLVAIADAPLLGHGSWAKNQLYVDILIDKYRQMAEFNPAITLSDEIHQRGDLIPTHSHVIGAWVESGIIGALFWVMFLASILKCFSRVISYGAYPPILICTSLIVPFLWDFLFSPFGGATRMIDAALLVAVAALAAQPLQCGTKQ